MSDLENGRTRAEALESAVSDRASSANRARLWAGLNRYLASEAGHAQKAAREEKARELKKEERGRAGDRSTGDEGRRA